MSNSHVNDSGRIHNPLISPRQILASTRFPKLINKRCVVLVIELGSHIKTDFYFLNKVCRSLKVKDFYYHLYILKAAHTEWKMHFNIVNIPCRRS